MSGDIAGTKMSGIARLPTPNATKKAPAGVGMAVYEAVSGANSSELADLCKEWAGNAVIDRYKGPNKFEKSREKTALMLAAAEGKESAVTWLLSAGAKANYTNGYGSNVLMSAAASGNVSIVRILLCEPGVLVNAQDMSGYSALYLASHKGHVDIVRLLLADEQCDVNIRSGDSTKACTPLHEAAFYGHTEIVQLLADDLRVNLNAKNSLGQSAIAEARRNSKHECVRILKAAALARGIEGEENCTCVCF